MIARKIFSHGTVQHLLGRTSESLLTPPTTLLLLHCGLILSSLLTLVIVYHVWINTHTLDHTAAGATLITMLVVQLFNQLEQVVIDLRLISLFYIFLLLSIDMHLRFKHGLTVWSTGAWSCTATPLCSCHGVESTLRYGSRDHGTISSLLLYSNDDFTIPLAFPINCLRHTASMCSLILMRSVWRSVQVWIFTILGLVLHLELCEESLLELCLLARADWHRLSCDLLGAVELIKEMLVKVVAIEWAPIPTKVHVLVRAISTLMS